MPAMNRVRSLGIRMPIVADVDAIRYHAKARLQGRQIRRAFNIIRRCRDYRLAVSEESALNRSEQTREPSLADDVTMPSGYNSSAISAGHQGKNAGWIGKMNMHEIGLCAS